MSRTVLMGLLAGGLGVAVIMLAAPADLFGRVPAITGNLSAPASVVAVVDGQTLRLRGTVLRLQGVVAPPRGQACSNAGGAEFDCGAAASQKLASLIQGHDVACKLDGRDAAGFLQAQCTAGGTHLNGAMTAQSLQK